MSQRNPILIFLQRAFFVSLILKNTSSMNRQKYLGIFHINTYLKREDSKQSGLALNDYRKI